MNKEPQFSFENEPNEVPGKKIGRGMAVLAWLAIGGFLIFIFDDLVDKKANPNQSPESRSLRGGGIEVILQRNSKNHYVTAGEINGYSVTFLLDTGATNVVIPKSVADNIGLLPGRLQRANTANGIIEIYATNLSQLSIGNLTLFDVEGSINKHMKGEHILLGMSALGEVEILQKGQQLQLRLYPNR